MKGAAQYREVQRSAANEVIAQHSDLVRRIAHHLAARLPASVEVDDVRRAWYDHAEGPLAWWWIRAIYLEPATELIVDDDEGSLYRVPFTIASDDSITFSEPAPVRIEYVDSPAPATAARGRRSAAASAAVFSR